MRGFLELLALGAFITGICALAEPIAAAVELWRL